MSFRKAGVNSSLNFITSPSPYNSPITTLASLATSLILSKVSYRTSSASAPATLNCRSTFSTIWVMPSTSCIGLTMAAINGWLLESLPPSSSSSKSISRAADTSLGSKWCLKMLFRIEASSMRSNLLSNPATRDAFFSSSSLINVLMCSKALVLSSSPSSCASTMFSCSTVSNGIGLSALLKTFLILPLTSLISPLPANMSCSTDLASSIRRSTAFCTAAAIGAARPSAWPNRTWISIMSSGYNRASSSSTSFSICSSLSSSAANSRSSGKTDFNSCSSFSFTACLEA
mmetsp:Transcript_75000/g.139955  ORF Transcript_75000/g.139955 Transcript_75000/m.139955 type:complete len:288 (+) Transcript_75000:116-979(+)